MYKFLKLSNYTQTHPQNTKGQACIEVALEGYSLASLNSEKKKNNEQDEEVQEPFPVQRTGEFTWTIKQWNRERLENLKIKNEIMKFPCGAAG